MKDCTSPGADSLWRAAEANGKEIDKENAQQRGMETGKVTPAAAGSNARGGFVAMTGSAK